MEGEKQGKKKKKSVQTEVNLWKILPIFTWVKWIPINALDKMKISSQQDYI